jgi:hypothetical protein
MTMITDSAAAVLLGGPAPDVMATARVSVASDVRTMVTAWGTTVAIPEYAQALVRGWAGRPLLPTEWASDVAATYLTLRLEAAQWHTGVRLIDPLFRGWCRLPGTSAVTPELSGCPG